MTPLGIKRSCPNCSAKFYDLNKRPASCPKCDHTYDPTVQMRARRSRRAAPEVEHGKEDMLVAHMAKAKAALKTKAKKVEPEEEEIGGVGIGDDAIDEMDDIENLEELEEIEESSGEEDSEMDLEEDEVGDAVLIDKVDDDEEAAAEEEEEKPRKGKAKRK